MKADLFIPSPQLTHMCPKECIHGFADSSHHSTLIRSLFLNDFASTSEAPYKLLTKQRPIIYLPPPTLPPC